MIDLLALRALIAVDDHGTVAAAAAATGYTPSAISQQIKRLERESAVAVLERVGRRVALTEQGRALVDDGRRILSQLEEVESRLHQRSPSPSGLVRVGAFATAVRGLVAPLLADLAESAPGLRVALTEQEPAEAVALVASGQLDLAVVHAWVGVPLHVPATLEVAQVGTDVADILLVAGHPLAGRPWLTPGDLLAEPWISTPTGTICHAWLLTMYAGFPHGPRVACWSAEFATHVALVRAGVGVALVPRLGRGPLPAGVVAVEVRDPVPTRQLQVVHRRTQRADPAVRHLRERVAALAAPVRGPAAWPPSGT